MIVLRLALQSLRNRWLTALLTVLAIAVSIMLLLGVEKVRAGARQSFADTISGTDLIVGARSGSIQLLLYAVFRIGNATNNITWPSYQDIASRPEIAWVVPLSLGDSHRGFRVLGTTPDYFTHYKYRQAHGLAFASGAPFADLFDAVVGADVAAALGYKVGDPIVVSHGLGAVSFVEHDDKPFRVSGVLEKTGTPVDRTVHVSLEAIEAIHVDWQSGGAHSRPIRLGRRGAQDGPQAEGDHGRAARPQVEARRPSGCSGPSTSTGQEPLSAILPGAALQELWGLVGTAETALKAVSAMVVATALLGMVTMILTTLNERRREMAILRSVGARPRTVLGLLMAEAGVLTVAGIALGVVLLYAALLLLQPYVDTTYGLHLPIEPPKPAELVTLGNDRGRRLSCRAAAGAACLSPVAGGRHDGQNMRRGFPWS